MLCKRHGGRNGCLRKRLLYFRFSVNSSDSRSKDFFKGRCLMIEMSSKTVTGPVIRLHPADNVVIARIDVAIGTPVPSEDFVCRSQVTAGYKIAARSIRKGEPIH